MNPNEPLVSVVLPCFNASKTISRALNSIIKQTYRNLEILVIDDGSTDDSSKIIEQIALNDKRVFLIKNEHNLGLIATLNKVLKLVRGKYIARMDADDFSYPNRIKKQVDLMESNQSIVACSANRREININTNIYHKSLLPVNNDEIKVTLIFNPPITNPCSLIRSKIVKQNNITYDERCKYAEDYDFWVNLFQYGGGYNFREVLLDYSSAANSQTKLGVNDLNKRFLTISYIQQKALSIYGIKLDKKQQKLHFVLSETSYIRSLDFNEYPIEYIKIYFEYIRQELVKSRKLSKSSINNILGLKYIKILIFNRSRISTKDSLILIKSSFFIYGLFYYLKYKI